MRVTTLHRQSRIRGFTLVEVLVAFLIFGLIGVISSQLMSRTIDAQADLSGRGARLGDIHRAMHILQRDVMQLLDRPIRDQYGDPLQPLVIGTGGVIEFTRGGFRNPLRLPRAEVQRVGYLVGRFGLVCAGHGRFLLLGGFRPH